MSIADQIQWQPDIVPDKNFYNTPDGRFPRITHVLDTVLGFGKNNLIRWGASLEREHCLDAARVSYDDYYCGMNPAVMPHPETFATTIRARLGRFAFQRKKEAAADIGTEAHKAIQRYRLGQKIGDLSGPATVAFQAAVKFLEREKLEPVASEKSCWRSWIAAGTSGPDRHGYGCTLDDISVGPFGLEIIDWKSSAGIYESHHYQVGAQSLAMPTRPARCRLVRLPKSLDDPLLRGEGIEVVELGDILVYDEKRRIKRSQAEMEDAARSIVDHWFLMRGQ